MSTIVTLTTDFSPTDPYVGVMKGVILSRAPGSELIDLAHGLPQGQILRATLVLLDSRAYFPAGTVHVAVVDPGVGTDRRALAARAGGGVFFAPDNGVLWELLRDDLEELRTVENRGLLLEEVSRTFHGRDVFAPAAAYVACGGSLAELGPEVSLGDIVRLEIPRPGRREGAVLGEVLYADGFGNVVSNIKGGDLARVGGVAGVAGQVRVTLLGRQAALVDTYAEGEKGELLALWGSSGRLEFAVRDGSAAETFGAGAGAEVRIECA